MEEAARYLWGPFLVYGLPLAALTLAAAVRRRRKPTGSGRPSPAADTTFPARSIAVCAGLAAVAAVAASVEKAGPGVLPWLWVGAGLFSVAARAFAGQPVPGDDRMPGPVALRRWLWAAAAILVVAPLGGMGLGAALSAATGWPSWPALFPAAALALACIFPGMRRAAVGAAPVAAGLLAALCLVNLLADPAAARAAVAASFQSALTYRPVVLGALSGTVTVAMAHGAARALLISWGPFWEGGASGGRRAAAGVGVGIFAALGLATLVGLVVAMGPGDAPVAERALLPMERPHARGLRPNPEVGQTVVLPEDTPLRPGRTYPMVLRADPRGHAFFQARLLKKRNSIAVPAFEVLARTETVVFRAKPKFQARNPGWDVRIPVERIERTVQGRRFFEFRPKDPSLDLGRLIQRRSLDDTPYLVAEDFHFLGRVARAVAPDELGEHLAMYEVRPEDAPDNPAFHEFFRMGYRGPYPDDGGPRPPWAFVGTEGFDAEPGTRLALAFRSPPRGSNLLGITRTGALQAPPWRFLMQADTVVLRHDDGPAHDIYVPVQAAMKEGRLVFESATESFRDFRVVERMEHLSGPYLVVPEFRFDVEVRRGRRFPGKVEGRRALVPLDPRGEPMGPEGSLPYDPHPGALLTTDLAGPFPAVPPGFGVATARVARHLGPMGAVLWVAAALCLFTAPIGGIGDRMGPAPAGVMAAAAATAVAGVLAPDRILAGADAALAVLGILATMAAAADLRRRPR